MDFKLDTADVDKSMPGLAYVATGNGYVGALTMLRLAVCILGSR